MHCQLDTTPRPFEIEEKDKKLIDRRWRKFTKWRDVNVVSDLCRITSQNGEEIKIATDVSYRDVVGLRWPRLKQPKNPPFKVVTAMGIVKTSDNYLVMIPRDSGDWPPSIECPGGFIRAEYLKDGHISIADFISKRVAEDLYLDQEAIKCCEYLDIYDAKDIMEYMLLYKIDLNLSREEIKNHRSDFVTLPGDYKPDAPCQNCISLIHSPSRGALLKVSKV